MMSDVGMQRKQAASRPKALLPHSLAFFSCRLAYKPFFRCSSVSTSYCNRRTLASLQRDVTFITATAAGLVARSSLSSLPSQHDGLGAASAAAGARVPGRRRASLPSRGPMCFRRVPRLRLSLLLLQPWGIPFLSQLLFVPCRTVHALFPRDLLLHVQRRNVLRPRRNMVHELPLGPDVGQRRVELLLDLLFVHVMHLLLRAVGLLLLRQYLSRRVLPNGVLGLLGLLIHCGLPKRMHSLLRGRAVPLWI